MIRVGTDGISGRPRLATPGAVLLLAGLALLWWGTGIFRGESTSGGLTKIMRRGAFPKKGTTPDTSDRDAGGGGSARTM